MVDPHGELLARLGPDACGIEIGAHRVPVRGVSPYYLDLVFSFAGTDGRVDVQADATALPIPDSEIDYLCSSHVLEHLPNPLAGLLEWARVLRPGGWLYLVVPDKRFTFDASRQVTPPEHMIEDFERKTATADEAHVRDFIYGCEWDRMVPDPHPEGPEVHKRQHLEMYLKHIAAGEPVDIHFHTFTSDSLTALLRRSGLVGGSFRRFKVVAAAERHPPERGDGIGLLLKKVGTHHPTPLQTYELAKPHDLRRPLKLVCPETLVPVTLRNDGNGAETLEVSDGSRRYAFRAGVPLMLPRDGAHVQRTWDRPLQRGLPFGARVRGLFSRRDTHEVSS